MPSLHEIFAHYSTSSIVGFSNFVNITLIALFLVCATRVLLSVSKEEEKIWRMVELALVVFLTLCASARVYDVFQREYVDHVAALYFRFFNGIFMCVAILGGLEISQRWRIRLRRKLETAHAALEAEIEPRQKAETNLKFYEEIVLNIAEGVCLVSRNTNEILYANPKVEEMFGYQSGELLGESIDLLLAEKNNSSSEMGREIQSDVVKNKRVWRGEILRRRKNGELFWTRTSLCTRSFKLWTRLSYRLF